VYQGLQAHKAHQVTLVETVLPVPLVLRVEMEVQETKVPLDLPDHEASRVNRDCLDLLDEMV